MHGSKGGFVHVSRNDTLITRSLDGCTDFTVPNVFGTHDYCTSTVGRHRQEYIASVLKRISTECPVGLSTVAEISRVISERFRDVAESIGSVLTLRSGHTRIDLKGESRITSSKTITSDSYLKLSACDAWVTM
jgi:hypothetical protein